eukprot:TRINITY_DN6422_c2_g2_i1.p1 TRINITY_DN6422_c2_g2~~TRINITY_DN6422_c2_g2_i1.p1  ORF type:complete len:248 (+),score=32.79 TRINITY_DN6422_c2_g2_i1:24-767(+)
MPSKKIVKKKRAVENETEAPTTHQPKKAKKDAKKDIVIILESAGIAITDLGKKKNQVLSHDKDGNFLDAKGQPTWLFRPDIVHQVLLAVFDMPLCKEGHVKVYINTIKHKAIEMEKTTRIPRTFKRFCGLISQLIDQGKVVNPETDLPLCKVLNFPVRQKVPEHAAVHALCCSEDVAPRNVYNFVESLDPSETHYFVIPCRDNSVWPEPEEGYGDYHTEKLVITQYETNPVCLIHKLSNALERHWGI